jgi:hypothetical protein
VITRLRSSSVGVAAAVMIGGGTSALAQHGTRLEGDTSIMDGAMVGILAMLAVTFAMQGAFAAFFFYLRRRAKRMADVGLDTEWSEVHSAPRRL